RAFVLATGLNMALVVCIFVLDAQYLEMAASAGERIYAAVQRLRRGGITAVQQPRPGSTRYRLPDLPWWDGIGPLAWRQLIAIPRSQGIGGLVLLAIVIPAFPIALTLLSGSAEAGFSIAIALLSMSPFIMSMLFAFDFRSDLDRMDVLK